MFHRIKNNLVYKAAVWVIVLTFGTSLVCQPVYAQTGLNLPVPGTMVLMSPHFTPTMIKGMTIYPEDPFKFDFIIDRGDTTLEGDDFKAESTKLIKYFLASLTTSEEKMWVNLSPYEKDRIIADGFDTTEMGRDLLAQDYILKQLTASLLYPENELGKSFWNKVYAQAQEKLGTNDIPMDTFNKVWIIPERAEVYVHGKSAFVVGSHLKVMLEEDYAALNHQTPSFDQPKIEDKQVPAHMKEVLKEIIIPEIEKEINEGKNFAQLRQIYHSLILATWYKKNLKKSLFGQVYVDKNKTKGVDVEDKQIKQKIYEQYLAAFKKGAYDYIKEDYDPATQEVISKKYFSGGVNAAMMGTVLSESLQLPRGDLASLSEIHPEAVTVRIETIDAAMKSDSPKDNREGFGLSVGKLTAKQSEYATKLRTNQTLQTRLVSLSDVNFKRILNALVRFKDKSLEMRPELLNAEDIKAILNYETFDVGAFAQKILAEKNKYEAKKDNEGNRLFSDKQIEELLYQKLIPLQWIEELMADGLNKSNAI